MADLYEVPTKALKQAVRRNRDRFPEDFLIELTLEEGDELSRSQFVTLKRGENTKYRPFAFTQEGVVMLSSVLRTERAVQANIGIMRAFVQQRELLRTHAELAHKIGQLEKKYDHNFKLVFDAIRDIMAPPVQPKKQIGFKKDGR